MATNKTFDYVVVGGGQSGLVVASRLSEDPSKTVLVIEAGGNTMEDYAVNTPGMVTTLYEDPKYDWNFTSVPQPHVNNKTIPCARGKGLGGTSSMNFGSVLYSSREDFASWTALGNEGWDFDTVMEYYRKAETFCAPADDAATQELYRDELNMDLHGKSGPVRIGYNADYSIFNEAWSQTFQKLGFYSPGDGLSGQKIGAFRSPLTIDPETSKRVTSASAYYGSAVAARPNLTVWTECYVQKILLKTIAEDDVLATGVELTNSSGELFSVNATCEVILAAGTIKSPHILELSGIGGRDLLTKHGIPVFVDNPNVGENLQDHPLTSTSFEVGEDMWSGDLFANPHFFQAVEELYKSTGTGPLAGTPLSFGFTQPTHGGGKVGAEEIKNAVDTYVHGVEYADFPSKDLQYKLITDVILNEEEPSVVYMFIPLQVNSGPNTEMSTFFGKQEPESFVTMIAYIPRPFSRGVVHIESPDPKKHPMFDPRHLSHIMDLEVLARLMQFIDKFASTEPFSNQLKPGGRRLPGGDVKDLGYAREAVKERFFTAFSPTGTCAMMPRSLGGVVSDKLIVHGTRNLRVVCASIIPIQPLGSLQATVYAVAEKAADLIKQANK